MSFLQNLILFLLELFKILFGGSFSFHKGRRAWNSRIIHNLLLLDFKDNKGIFTSILLLKFVSRFVVALVNL